MVRRSIYKNVGYDFKMYSDAVYTGHTRVTTGGTPVLPENLEAYFDSTFMSNCSLSSIECTTEYYDDKAPRVAIFRLSSKDGENKADYWLVFMYISISDVLVPSLSHEQLRDYAYHQLREYGFPEQIITLNKLLLEAAKHNDVNDRPLYIVPATHPSPFELPATSSDVEYPNNFHRPWYHGRVVLVGDAAHGSPPYRPQGIAMGMEDVYELVARLSNDGVWKKISNGLSPNWDELESAFQEYYDGRVKRVCRYQRSVMGAMRLSNVEEWHKDRKFLFRYNPSLI